MIGIRLIGNLFKLVKVRLHSNAIAAEVFVRTFPLTLAGVLSVAFLDIGSGFNQIVGLVNQGSVGKALTKIYPEANLVAARFPKLASLVGLNVSLNVAEVKSYIEYLGKELRITKPEDWYCVTLKQMRAIPNYKTIPNRLGGLPAMLARVYPDHPWDMTKFFFGIHRTQQMGTLKPYGTPARKAKLSKADKEFEKEQERERLSVQDADS